MGRMATVNGTCKATFVSNRPALTQALTRDLTRARLSLVLLALLARPMVSRYFPLDIAALNTVELNGFVAL